VDKLETIAAVCRSYVRERRSSKSAACAHDAEQRFERTVYGTAFGRLRLSTLRAPELREWRDRLRGRGGKPLAAAAANRTLTALKAALNFAIYEGYAAAELTSELRRVRPLPGGKRRRDLYLDLEQRRALLRVATGAVRDLIEAVALTGARAGELVSACVSQFDARTQVMTFRGKTGERTVPLSPAAVALFERLAGARAPQARLLVRDDGRPWAHSDWDERVRDAARAAGLPSEPGAGTCLYTLRHSFITEALLGGLSTLEVARLVGTSVTMIEKHYGHLAVDAARRRLAAVAML
jgi:integrase